METGTSLLDGCVLVRGEEHSLVPSVSFLLLCNWKLMEILKNIFINFACWVICCHLMTVFKISFLTLKAPITTAADDKF